MSDELVLIPRLPEPYDSGWKRVLYRYFFQAIEFFFPKLFRLFDTSVAPEFLDKELKQIAPGNEVGHRNADVLVKVRLHSGQDQVLLCHLELQSQVDYSISERSFVYAYRIFDKFVHFPLTILLLADSDKNYRPTKFELRPTGFGGMSLDFLVIKTLDFRPRLQELSGSEDVIAQVLWVYLEYQNEKPEIVRGSSSVSRARQWLDLKTRIMKHLLGLNLDGNDVSELLLFLDWVVRLSSERKLKEGTVAFVTSYERVGRMIGKEEGIAEGMVEGIAEGQRLTLRSLIIQVLQKKNTLTDAEQLRIKECQDLGTLEKALDLCIDEVSKEEVLKLF